MPRQTTSNGRGHRRGVFVALAVIAACLLSPGDSRAACGDHVRYPGDPHVQPREPVAPVQPCQGPNCSRAPTRAPVVPPTLPSTTLDHDTALSLAVVVPVDRAWRWVDLADGMHAVHCSFPPEPPPRASC